MLKQTESTPYYICAPGAMGFYFVRSGWLAIYFLVCRLKVIACYLVGYWLVS